MKRGVNRYYQRIDGAHRTLIYLGTKDSEKRTILAEKYRNKKYISSIEKEISQLNKSLRHLDESNPGADIEKVWESLPKQIRILTVPVPSTDEEYALIW